MARYYRSQLVQPISQFVPEPLELYQNKLEGMQKQQDTYTAQVAGLDKPFNFINTQDETLAANKTKQEVQDKLNSLNDLNFNDPNSRKKAIEAIKEVRDIYGPTGQIGAYEANYTKFQDYNKTLDELAKKAPKEGGITSTQKDKLKKIALDTFKATGKVSPSGYNQFNGLSPAPFSDVTDQADKLAKDWKADSIKRGGYYDTDGRFIKKSTTEIESVDPKEIYKFVLPQLMSDPMNQAYVAQKTMLDHYGTNASNEDQLNAYNSVFDNAAKFAAAKYGYKKQSSEEDWNESKLYLHNLKKSEAADDAAQQFTTEYGATESAGDWTKVAELDKYYNSDGSIKTTGIMDVLTSPLAGTETSGMSQTGLSIDKTQKVTKNVDKQIAEAQTELYKKTSKLGLNIVKPDGTVDGEATRLNAMKYFQGLAVFSNYTVPFINKDIVNNISSDMFGKTSNIHNTEIYKQGEPETKGQFETPESKEQFKNSRVVGLDYTATQPGAMKFVAPNEVDSDGKSKNGDTPYIAISRNKKLQDQMAPIQQLTTKSLAGARSGDTDDVAQKLTSMLSGSVVKDVFGHTVALQQLGIPVGSSRDLDGTLYVSYLDNSTGSPMIQVLKKSPNSPLQIKSLDEIQEDKTGEIFNTGGALSQYQKQTSKEIAPSTYFDEE